MNENRHFKPKVLVVGGGCAGMTFLHASRKNFEITLLEPKTYAEVPFANARAAVRGQDGGWSTGNRRAFKDHPMLSDQAYRKGGINSEYIQGKLISLDSKESLTAEIINASGKTEIVHWSIGPDADFHHVVLALGSHTGSVFKAVSEDAQERVKELDTFSALIREAEHIVLVGGGVIGCEVAAEILAYHNDTKDITIVNSGSRLMPSLKEKTSKKATAILDKLSNGVRVLNNERVDLEKTPGVGILDVKGFDIVTENGTAIPKVNLIIKCYGYEMDMEPFKKSFSELITKDGLVVEPTLQLKGCDNIWVIGDLAALAELIGKPEKLGSWAMNFHAPTVRSNILKYDARKSLKPLTSLPDMFFISLGPNNAVVQAFLWVPEFLAVFVKAKKLFVPEALSTWGFSKN